MRLLIFPEAPDKSNGYGIAVREDYFRLNVTPDDKVIWYTNNNTHELERPDDVFIGRPRLISYERISQVLKFHQSCEISTKQVLESNVIADYDEIFCGDVILYRAIRKLFPNTPLTVRFHNCFARIQRRIEALELEVSDIKFKINLLLFSKLEHEIFRDKKCRKIFISDEDLQYYHSISGASEDAEVWGMEVDRNKVVIARDKYKKGNLTRLVWFGGAEAHKTDSIKWFRDEVFPKLYERNNTLEFHLFGRGTEKLRCNHSAVHVHGFYQGDGFPFFGTSLYVNPDLMGGGVKTKLKTYLEDGIPFISSPFGFEGFAYDLVDARFCMVESPQNWVEKITERILQK